jgi:DNA-binding CsgD family transcriptional regulator
MKITCPACGFSYTGDLTDTQKRLCELVLQGKQNKAIAFELGRSNFTVRNNLRLMFKLSGATNRTQLALWYEQQKLRKNSIVGMEERSQSLNLFGDAGFGRFPLKVPKV